MTMTTAAASKPSDRLTTKIQLVVPEMLRETTAMWTRPGVRKTYVEWMRVMHGAIRATIPMMLAATEECLHRRDDPVAEGFAAYLAKHIREEYGHDTWVVEDYAAAGCDPADLTDMAVGGTVAALIGSQYYWMRHVHPIALLGYMTVIEGYPPSPELISYLKEHTGLPENAFRALERHAVLDIKHRADLYHQLDALPLTPRHEALIGMSALHTATTVRDVARGVRHALGN
jgi:Iron-containing redox enzyme